MTTLDRVEAHTAMEALRVYAADNRRKAKRRTMAGEAYKATRAVLRNNAAYAERTAQKIADAEGF